ncbi:hypothetical protein KKC59_02035 [bacterium]|nr:hypothetical protein [bacterium]
MKKIFLSLIFTIIILAGSLTAYSKYIFSEKELIAYLNNNPNIPLKFESASINLLQGITIKNGTFTKKLSNTAYIAALYMPNIKLNINMLETIKNQKIVFDNITILYPKFELTEQNINNYINAAANKTAIKNNILGNCIISSIKTLFKSIDSKTITIKNASISTPFKTLSSLNGAVETNLKNKEILINLDNFKTRLGFKPGQTNIDFSYKNENTAIESSFIYKNTLLKISSGNFKYNNSRCIARGQYNLKSNEIDLNVISNIDTNDASKFIPEINDFKKYFDKKSDVSFNASGALDKLELLQGKINDKENSNITFNKNQLTISYLADFKDIFNILFSKNATSNFEALETFKQMLNNKNINLNDLSLTISFFIGKNNFIIVNNYDFGLRLENNMLYINDNQNIYHYSLEQEIPSLKIKQSIKPFKKNR